MRAAGVENEDLPDSRPKPKFEALYGRRRRRNDAVDTGIPLISGYFKNSHRQKDHEEETRQRIRTGSAHGPACARHNLSTDRHDSGKPRGLDDSGAESQGAARETRPGSFEDVAGRSGPASVWRIYAYLWTHQGHVYGSEKTIQRGTGLSADAVADAIYTLWEQGVLDLEDRARPRTSGKQSRPRRPGEFTWRSDAPDRSRMRIFRIFLK